MSRESGEGRIVDDESLGDPRFIDAAWEAYSGFRAAGNDEAASRVAQELGESWDQGHDIFASDKAPLRWEDEV